MRRLADELLLFGVALQFLTRLPVKLPRWQDDWLNRCARYFSLVGALVGVCSGVVLWGAAQLWSPWVAALLALMSSALLTGAFHEDGLADSFDALGGAVSRDRALSIMKDSRIGSYGALALILVTLLRAALLAELVAIDALQALLACVLVHGLARTVAVGVMVSLPYAGNAEHAKAKPLAQSVDARQLFVACLFCLPLLALRPAQAPALLLVAAATVWLMRAWLHRRLGGYTGDTLGATEQLAEAALLLSLVALA
ncbi:MAG: adenosylcobinamide-GDP ribazoletransferase [Inhella sp.]